MTKFDDDNGAGGGGGGGVVINLIVVAGVIHVVASVRKYVVIRKASERV